MPQSILSGLQITCSRHLLGIRDTIGQICVYDTDIIIQVNGVLQFVKEALCISARDGGIYIDIDRIVIGIRDAGHRCCPLLGTPYELIFREIDRSDRRSRSHHQILGIHLALAVDGKLLGLEVPEEISTVRKLNRSVLQDLGHTDLTDIQICTFIVLGLCRKCDGLETLQIRDRRYDETIRFPRPEHKLRIGDGTLSCRTYGLCGRIRRRLHRGSRFILVCRKTLNHIKIHCSYGIVRGLDIGDRRPYRPLELMIISFPRKRGYFTEKLDRTLLIRVGKRLRQFLTASCTKSADG